MVTKYVKKNQKTNQKTAKKTVQNDPKMSEAAVKKYVKNMLSKNVEDKFQEEQYTENQALLVLSVVAGNFTFYNTTLSNVFNNVIQGTGQGQRVGNEIKLKKWVIRGAITPVYPGQSGPVPVVITRPQLYVTLYIGYRLDYTPIDPSLPDFYQSGNTTYGPTGIVTDRIAWLNKDAYHITWKKTYKVGTADSSAIGAGAGLPVGYFNNDFSLTKQFTVNLCKHGFKDRIIKYNDIVSSPQDAKIVSTELWAVITNADGSPVLNTTVGQSSYQLTISNNIMYQDA